MLVLFWIDRLIGLVNNSSLFFEDDGIMMVIFKETYCLKTVGFKIRKFVSSSA